MLGFPRNKIPLIKDVIKDKLNPEKGAFVLSNSHICQIFLNFMTSDVRETISRFSMIKFS